MELWAASVLKMILTVAVKDAPNSESNEYKSRATVLQKWTTILFVKQSGKLRS